MLPEDRSAIPGAIPATRKYAGAHVAVEQVVEGRLVELRRWAKPRRAGVVDQGVHRPDVVDEGSHVPQVVEVGGRKPSPAALCLDVVKHLGTTFGIAAVDDDVPTVASEPQRGGPANARSRPRHQRYAQSIGGRTVLCTHFPSSEQTVLCTHEHGRPVCSICQAKSPTVSLDTLGPPEQTRIVGGYQERRIH